MTARTQIMAAFCAAISAERGVRFSANQNLPARSAFDLSETANYSFGCLQNTITASVESLLEPSTGQSEGESLDVELADLIKKLMNDSTLDSLADGVVYTESSFSYSENGSSVVGLVASFEIKYSVSPATPEALI